MAFEVKATVTGEGNSYTSVAYADAYFADRGVTAWTGVNTAKEGALIRATDYLEGRFGGRFTCEVLEAEEVPDQLQKATCEYAVRALTAALAPDPVIGASGIVTVATRKKVGPLETESEAIQTGPGSTMLYFRPYPAADMLLHGLLYSTNRVIR